MVMLAGIQVLIWGVQAMQWVVAVALGLIRMLKRIRG